MHGRIITVVSLYALRVCWCASPQSMRDARSQMQVGRMDVRRYLAPQRCQPAMRVRSGAKPCVVLRHGRVVCVRKLVLAKDGRMSKNPGTYKQALTHNVGQSCARNAHHQQDDELMFRQFPASVQARTNVSQHIHTRIHRQVVPGQAATQSRPCKSVLSPGAYPPSAAPAGQTADALQTAENASDPCRTGPCTCWPEMASVTRVRTC